ncbi:HET-domain-containing protein [Macroventuria anomochaeta]|uniref:HET-domain-containing protein n=1 Tax=Macroventuria anomochaeta TaxID=301207 RepID=A0ACB6SB13_9PLEO|nr:HET-domain-containing protein [Macroventuria anomochaeta]KAF2631249.1 HET-domain-containing protein [Macroventuria anomochaeta]
MDSTMESQDLAHSHSRICQFCVTILTSYPAFHDPRYPPLRLQGLHRCFHAECTNCSLGDNNGTLCAQCDHLRLEHLICCRQDQTPFSLTVRFGTFDTIKTTEHCSFHRLLLLSAHTFIQAFRPEHVPPPAIEFSLYIVSGELASTFGTMFLIGSAPDFSRCMPALKTYISILNLHNAMPRPPSSQIFLSSLIDWKTIRSWIRRCEIQHSQCSSAALNSSRMALPKGFQLVDVLHRRVIQPEVERCRYVALSYTWGKDPDESGHKASMSTIRELRAKGGLCAARMPITIEDAIQACFGLGERYIWVDRLRIVQDNFEEKEEQIAGMTAIFARAVFTVIIAHGNGMNDELPGIGKLRDYPTAVERFNDLQIRTCLPTFESAVTTSVWATRGWTYQEKLLCERKLYITSSQVFWMCRAGVVSEIDTPNEDNGGWTAANIPITNRFSRAELLRAPGQLEPFQAYVKHSANYNSLSLTYSSDIYNAFTGILCALYAPSNHMKSSIYNLPLKDFDAALLWHHIPGKKSSLRQRHADFYIPSWTWSSNTGKLNMVSSFLGSLVKWVLLSTTPGVSIEIVDSSDSVLLSSDDPDEPISQWYNYIASPDRVQPSYYMALATAHGCSGNNEMSDLLGEFQGKPIRELSGIIYERWATYSQYWKAMPATDLLFDRPCSLIPVVYLGTWAQTSIVRLMWHPRHRSCNGGTANLFNIVDPSGRLVGICRPSPTLPQDKTLMFDTETYKVMAISVGAQTSYECCFIQSSISDLQDPSVVFDVAYPHPDGTGVPLMTPPVINIMVLGNRGGLHFRHSIGWIYLRRWVELKRQFESIVLC